MGTAYFYWLTVRLTCEFVFHFEWNKQNDGEMVTDCNCIYSIVESALLWWLTEFQRMGSGHIVCFLFLLLVQLRHGRCQLGTVNSRESESTCHLQLECLGPKHTGQGRVRIPVRSARGPSGPPGERGLTGPPGPQGATGESLGTHRPAIISSLSNITGFRLNHESA